MDHPSHGRLRDSGPADQGERADGRHGKHHALERCAGLGAGQAACEVSGLDAGKNGGRIPVDQPAVDRRHRARFWAGKLGRGKCAAAGVKDRVVDETPREKSARTSEHKWVVCCACQC